MDFSFLIPDKQVKLQYWLDAIRECRTSGLTNQVWCEQNQISLKSYYYWIAKIRRFALEELPRKRNGIHSQPDRNTVLLPETSSGFTHVSLPARQTPHSSPAAVLQLGDMRIEIFEDTASESLTRILKAVQSC